MSDNDATGSGPGAALAGLGLAVVLGAQAVVVLDFSIVNVALPDISSQLHISSSSVQWVVTAYAVTFGGLLVLGGRIADLFGLYVDDVVLVPSGTVGRTTSGKVQRSATKARYLRGDFSAATVEG